jgi:hypothetical protein
MRCCKLILSKLIGWLWMTVRSPTEHGSVWGLRYAPFASHPPLSMVSDYAISFLNQDLR